MRTIRTTDYHAAMTEATSDWLFAGMGDAWRELADRFQAYRLILPGSPKFVCQPDVCTAYCCHAYSVSMGAGDVERMRRLEGLELIEFLEVEEDGSPVTLPLAQPYLLARADNHCRLLGKDLRCSRYHGRPDACRLYPHFVVFWDPEAGRARTTPSKHVAASFGATLRRQRFGSVPLLLGHSECPGFTGEPLSESDWWGLFESTYQLQYAAV